MINILDFNKEHFWRFHLNLLQSDLESATEEIDRCHLIAEITIAEKNLESIADGTYEESPIVHEVWSIELH